MSRSVISRGFKAPFLPVLVLLLGAFAAPVGMASSRTIAYQGFLSTPSGDPLNEDVVLTFRIYRDAVGSERLWTERHESVPVRAGLFLVALGSVSPLENVPELFEIGRTLYVSIEVEEDGEMIPRLRLGSVPYSLAATGQLAASTIVDCTRGETIADALARAPAGGNFSINLIGTCVENVVIVNNGIQLRGDGSAKIVGITPNPNPVNAVVWIDGARSVELRGLTIEGAPGDTTGMAGILVDDAASGQISSNSTVQNVDGVGVHVVDNSSFDIRAQVLDVGSHGVLVEGNSHVDLQDTLVERHGGRAFYLTGRSSGSVRRSTLRSSVSCTVSVDGASSLRIEQDNLLEASFTADVCATVTVYRGSSARVTAGGSIIRNTIAANYVDNSFSPEAGGMALDVEVKSSFRTFNNPLLIEGWITSFDLTTVDIRHATINGHLDTGGLTSNLRLRDQSGTPGRVTLNGNVRMSGILSIRTGSDAAIINGNVDCLGGNYAPSNIRFHDPEDGYINCPQFDSDVAVTLSDFPDPSSTGATVTYVAEITNQTVSPAVEAVNVNASFALSGSAVNILSATGPQGACNTGGNTIECAVGLVRTGTPAFVTVEVQRTDIGQIVNDVTVTLDNNDPDFGNNTASEANAAQ